MSKLADLWRLRSDENVALKGKYDCYFYFGFDSADFLQASSLVLKFWIVDVTTQFRPLHVLTYTSDDLQSNINKKMFSIESHLRKFEDFNFVIVCMALGKIEKTTKYEVRTVFASQIINIAKSPSNLQLDCNGKIEVFSGVICKNEIGPKFDFFFCFKTFEVPQPVANPVCYTDYVGIIRCIFCYRKCGKFSLERHMDCVCPANLQLFDDHLVFVYFKKKRIPQKQSKYLDNEIVDISQNSSDVDSVVLPNTIDLTISDEESSMENSLIKITEKSASSFINSTHRKIETTDCLPEAKLKNYPTPEYFKTQDSGEVSKLSSSETSIQIDNQKTVNSEPFNAHNDENYLSKPETLNAQDDKINHSYSAIIKTLSGNIQNEVCDQEKANFNVNSKSEDPIASSFSMTSTPLIGTCPLINSEKIVSEFLHSKKDEDLRYLFNTSDSDSTTLDSYKLDESSKVDLQTNSSINHNPIGVAYNSSLELIMPNQSVSIPKQVANFTVPIINSSLKVSFDFTQSTPLLQTQSFCWSIENNPIFLERKPSSKIPHISEIMSENNHATSNSIESSVDISVYFKNNIQSFASNEVLNDSTYFESSDNHLNNPITAKRLKKSSSSSEIFQSTDSMLDDYSSHSEDDSVYEETLRETRSITRSKQTKNTNNLRKTVRNNLRKTVQDNSLMIDKCYLHSTVRIISLKANENDSPQIEENNLRKRTANSVTPTDPKIIQNQRQQLDTKKSKSKIPIYYLDESNCSRSGEVIFNNVQKPFFPIEMSFLDSEAAGFLEKWNLFFSYSFDGCVGKQERIQMLRLFKRSLDKSQMEYLQLWMLYFVEFGFLAKKDIIGILSD